VGQEVAVTYQHIIVKIVHTEMKVVANPMDVVGVQLKIMKMVFHGVSSTTIIHVILTSTELK